MRRGSIFLFAVAGDDGQRRADFFSQPGASGRTAPGHVADQPARTDGLPSAQTCHAARGTFRVDGQQRAEQELVVLPSRRLGKTHTSQLRIAAMKAAGWTTRLTAGATYFFAPGVAQKALNTPIIAGETQP